MHLYIHIQHFGEIHVHVVPQMATRFYYSVNVLSISDGPFPVFEILVLLNALKKNTTSLMIKSNEVEFLNKHLQAHVPMLTELCKSPHEMAHFSLPAKTMLLYSFWQYSPQIIFDRQALKKYC